MNGSDILSREIGEHIKKIDEAEPHNKNCDFGNAAKPALKLSLRLGEESLKVQKINAIMFLVIMASSLEVQNKNIIDWVLFFFAGK